MAEETKESKIDSYGRVEIIKHEDKPLPLYKVNMPEFSDAEREILKNATDFIPVEIARESEKFVTYEERNEFLRYYLKKRLTQELEVKNQPLDNVDILLSLAMGKFYGHSTLGVLLDDDELEDIAIHGIGAPAFVVHRKHGMCRSNIGFKDEKSINNALMKIAKNVGREINEENPLLDSRLLDGSRVNVAIPPAAPKGPYITIRKFRQKPFSITELIKLQTMDEGLAALLWACVEGFGIRPINMIVAGGPGSGKTTTLNAISSFIPQNEIVVTVEDTLELNFKFLDGWMPLEAAPSLRQEKSSITIDLLLQNALRMRPDRVIVGEVRGPGAITLLVAMDIGLNGSMGTLHANTARESITRMTNSPMNIPLTMLPLLDLIIVQNMIRTKEGGVRRYITQVAEIGHIIQDNVELGLIYEWDPQADKLARTQYPIKLKDTLAESAGITKPELDKELKRREELLRRMVGNDIMENNEVLKIIREYRHNPDEAMSKLKKKKGWF
ncbi:MAG: hypothetical protein A7316_04200 [Candidatus Altiarchaeales archaeon WOR_SM1_86-2]|nr:MAG: hypothetical protein A7316_04200 [Candidatus Altiarchaeales archaeon WOR_SM1_86-2]ODS41452.1 MAG: hypothetical protein A7315_06080 [Candidatus Altiarchaeales archaeon WOR_SM1_79]